MARFVKKTDTVERSFHRLSLASRVRGRSDSEIRVYCRFLHWRKMPSQCAMLISEPAGQEHLTSHRSQARREKPQSGIGQASLAAQSSAKAEPGDPPEGQDDVREILALPHKLDYPCPLINHNEG